MSSMFKEDISYLKLTYLLQLMIQTLNKTAVLSQLNRTTIEERWKLQRCKMVYRALNGQSPEYLTLLFNKSSSAHNYRTRASVSDGLLVPRARTNTGKQSFSHSGTVDWNQLPK